MTKIKIISNPYTREIGYYIYNEITGLWDDICSIRENSRLREDETGKAFLPFKIKEIVDIILAEYFVNKEPVEIVFEGTEDEYAELQSVCSEEPYCREIQLIRSPLYLENARFIRKEARETFESVYPIIKRIINDDEEVIKDLNKVSDALRDIVPLCVFGNYSSGKSTFINALIGAEVLPSGGDPVTAKIYKISRSAEQDCARICVDYLNEKIDISFLGDKYRFLSGSPENDLVKEVKNAIELNSKDTLLSRVNVALITINNYEKRDKTELVLGNIIEVEVPFSQNGILGKSANSFVIFDTPGSNSASNIDHGKVLEEALDGFSNGIPVWVSSYESMDSNDNAELCDKVLEIKALDKRFTMIIMNKADSSDLPEIGFAQDEIQDILDYTAIEKMYASGIFFVSSIMGLGVKKEGALTDRHYRRIYRQQKESYCDPEDEDYMTLYQYNIMPEQVKARVVQYSRDCQNLVYANSGLLCVETEMEVFASKHSAYNKCQMVHLFLNEVIKETNQRIALKTERLEKDREKRNGELDVAKQELIACIEAKTNEMEQDFDQQSVIFTKEYVDKNIDYTYAMDKWNELNASFRTEKSEEINYSDQEQEYEESINSMWNRFKVNGQNLFKGNFLESFNTMRSELVSDFKTVLSSRESKDESVKDIDHAVSDRLVKVAKERYRKNMQSAKSALSVVLRSYWKDNAETLRNQLITIIAGTEALTAKQRDEISSIILSYQPLEFDDDAENIFIKKRFLRSNVFGFMIGDSEKINLKRLANSYNSKIQENALEMSLDMNKHCFNSYKSWEKSLYAKIEQNITVYNPELRSMADMIKEDTDRILQLASDKEAISNALETINNMMSWKEETELE